MIKISTIQKQNNTILNTNELLDYLTQIILSKIDTQVQDKQNKLNETKLIYNEKKNLVKQQKKDLLNKSREISKLNKISKILTVITTLREEGRIVGNTRKQIIDLLNKINGLSITQLIKIEEKLIIAIPEERNLTTFS
jgi:hypothetical protein